MVKDFPKLAARIDPSPEIQQQIAATIKMCHEWKGTDVAEWPDPGTHRVQYDTTEASICNLLDDWPHSANVTGYGLLSAGAIGGIVGLLILVQAWRIVSLIYRFARSNVFVLRGAYEKKN